MEENVLIYKDIQDILVDNAKEYYGEIILRRAIPKYFDGLTEAQRRVIYTCYDKGWTSSKPHIKSARIVGEVLGRFHPHGDSLYDVSVNMSQSWKNNLCLIDFHGGNGSISGSTASAMRYTEERISKETEEILTEELKYNCVDFMLNFSQDEKEPSYLPAKLPIYLFNGCFGISAGYAVSVLPHNPSEVISECIKKIKNPDYEVQLLPSFPEGCSCTIINTNQVKEAYKDLIKAREKDYSKVVVRAVIEKDEKKNCLYITEIPYMKTINTLIKSIIDCTEEKEDPLHKGKKIPPKITDIKNVKDLTENNKPKILIQCKKDANLDVVISQLYEFSMCQSTIPISFLAVGHNENFKIFKSVTEYIELFLEFRMTTIKRIKLDLIKKYKLRVHILEGLLKVYDLIDEIIAKIKKSKSKKETVEMLINDYDLSEIQADHIAELKLYRLSRLEISKLEEEREELLVKVEGELSFFKEKDKLENLVIEELEYYKKKFSKIKNKTKFDNISYNSEEEKLNAIPDEDFMLLCTKNGYVKKLQLPKTQNKGGKGVSIGKLKDDDYVINTTVLNSRDSIFIFTEQGNVYKFKVYEIPTHVTTNLGYNISSFINNETVISMLPIKDEDIEDENKFILVATEQNKIKRVSLSEFKNVRNNGILYTRLVDDDRIISVEKVDMSINDSIIALNNLGNSIRVRLEDIPCSLRPAFGNSLFDTSLTKDGNCVTSVALVDENKEYYFLITQNGLGKKMLLSEFEPQNRGTKGKMACKVKDDDCAIKIIPVNEDDNVIIISSTSIINVPVSKISLQKRPTFGSTVKKCIDDEFIVDCTIQ